MGKCLTKSRKKYLIIFTNSEARIGARQGQTRVRPEAGQSQGKQLRTDCSAGKRGARSVK